MQNRKFAPDQQAHVAAPDGSGWQPTEGLSLASFTQSQTGMGGLFHEIVQLNAHTLDLIIGEVKQPDMPAAPWDATMQTQLVRSVVQSLKPQCFALPLQPKDIVAAANRLLAPQLHMLGAVVTLAYTRVDALANKVTWVSCGQKECLLLNTQDQKHLLSSQHLPLGMLAVEDLVQDQLDLSPGDTLFLSSRFYSDATEAGERQVRLNMGDALARLTRVHTSPLMALHRLRREMLSQVQASDPLALFLLKRDEVRSGSARLELPVSLDALSTLRDFVDIQAHDAQLPEDRCAVLLVAVVEVVTNVVRHAEGLLAGAPIELVTEISEEALTLNFNYLGDHFLPPEEPEASDLSSFPEGGFGLYIIHQACDEVNYLHNDGVNTVRLKLLREPSLS